MRWVLLIVVAACHKAPEAHTLPKPDPTTFAKLDADAQCEATAARVRPCAGDLLKAELAAMSVNIGGDPSLEADDREAAVMHRNECLGDPGYPTAVVACWQVEGCEAFATCVVKHQPERPSGSNRVR